MEQEVIDDEVTSEYKILIDGEPFNTEKYIVVEYSIYDRYLKYVDRNAHFPYWPTTIYGNITVEKIK